MPALIYVLCALTSFGCAALLLRGYMVTRTRLLLWGGLCFLGLTANNVLLFLDRIIFTETDMTTARLVVALIAMLLMVYGLIWESE
ncbi:MAG TPA: DUF5985 family protein [Casimicrobiaceae bacterium]|nr:DUF5985 family protein [Casimicrobiaceae bacterium]